MSRNYGPYDFKSTSKRHSRKSNLAWECFWTLRGPSIMEAARAHGIPSIVSNWIHARLYNISPNDFSPNIPFPRKIFPRMYHFLERFFPECTISPKDIFPNVAFSRIPFPRNILGKINEIYYCCARDSALYSSFALFCTLSIGSLKSSSTGSSFLAGVSKPVPLAVVSLDSR